MKRLLLHHLVGQYPIGGIAWQALHHLIGFRRLGYDAYYVEDSGSPAWNPETNSVGDDCSFGVEFLRRLMERFGLADRWAYLDGGRDVWHGMARESVARLYGEADGLVNLCGATRLREEHLRCPVRIYLETDPCFEQMKIALGDEESRAFLAEHTHHFTYAENLGAADCPVPTVGFHWRPTRPPVVLDLWAGGSAGERFTTVANWQTTGKDITYQGETYLWSKHGNFIRFQDLPRRSKQPFELAVGAIPDEAKRELAENGWGLADSYQQSRDDRVYHDYILGSRGEWTVAKDILVRTRCGWFSDRSVCYLAAGKPVVTQETGFSRVIPSGRGLFAFTDMEEIVAAVEEINRDYAAHGRAAREVASECFDAEKVLGRMLREAGL
jgi:hypothetical protein